MARKPRIHEPGAYYHVILRGNGGSPVFFSNWDRLFLYDLFKEVVSRFDCRIHGFCLMNNHVHIAIQAGETPLSKVIQTISFRHTRKINKKLKRIGHLFQGRYKAILVDEQSYLLELVRYIHLNPVRAGMVKSASDFRWSGHNAYLGKELIEWLTTDTVLGMFGRRIGAARDRYAAFIAEGTGEETLELLRKGKSGGRIIGDDLFVEKTLKSLKTKEDKINVPFDVVVGLVVRELGVSKKGIFSPSRERDLVKARAIAGLLARRHTKTTVTEMAQTFGIDNGGFSRTMRRYEELIEEDGESGNLFGRLGKALLLKRNGAVKGKTNKSVSQA